MAQDKDRIQIGKGEEVTVTGDDGRDGRDRPRGVNNEARADEARPTPAVAKPADTSRVTESHVETRAPVRPPEPVRPVEPTPPVQPVRRPDMDHDREVQIPEAFKLKRDRVHWGPIFAGLLTALTSLLLLGLLGLAIGLTTVNAGDAAARGAAPEGLGRNSAIWGAISAGPAFLFGGYVAAKTAAVFDRQWGVFNGLMVFLLAVPLTLWLAGQGLGTVLGSLGGLASGLSADPGQVQGAAQNAAGQAQQAAQNVQPVDVARAAGRARDTAWSTLLGMGLGTAAAGLGGALGTRRELEVNPRTGKVSE